MIRQTPDADAEGANQLCATPMDGKLTTGEMIRLRSHLMMRDVCRHLPDQFRELRELVLACEHEHAECSDGHMWPEVKARIFVQLKSSHQSKS